MRNQGSHVSEDDRLAPIALQLLSTLTRQSAQHVGEIDTDLAQIELLLREAIEKLTATFFAISDAVNAQQTAVASLLHTTGALQEQREHLQVLQKTIGVQINAAVTGLQFQDMTSQLIHSALMRASGVQQVFDVVAGAVDNISPVSNSEEAARTLAEAHNSITEHGVALDGALRKAVSQTHLESGDIELF